MSAYWGEADSMRPVASGRNVSGYLRVTVSRVARGRKQFTALHGNSILQSRRRPTTTSSRAYCRILAVTPLNWRNDTKNRFLNRRSQVRLLPGPPAFSGCWYVARVPRLPRGYRFAASPPVHARKLWYTPVQCPWRSMSAYWGQADSNADMPPRLSLTLSGRSRGAATKQEPRP